MQTYRSHVTQGGFDFRNGSEPYTAAKGVHTHDLVLERLDWILNDRKRRRHRTAPQSDAAEDVEEDIPPLFLMLGLQAPHCPLDEVPERFLVLYKQWLSELRASPSAVRSFFRRTQMGFGFCPFVPHAGHIVLFGIVHSGARHHRTCVTSRLRRRECRPRRELLTWRL